MEDHEIHVVPGSLEVRLSPRVELFLRSINPWWSGQPPPALPSYRRWLFATALRRLKEGLAPITVLRGSRQVGKTTLEQQVIRHLLEEEGVDPRRIFHVQFDELPRYRADDMPIYLLCSWFQQEVLGATFNTWAQRGEPAFLVFDEAQALEAWAPQLKSLVDHHTVRVLLTGSSAFRIEAGRDSLAGRISTLEMGPLLLREIAALRGFGDLEPGLPENGTAPLKERSFWEGLRAAGTRHREIRDRAFAALADRGGYPIAQIRPETSWEDLADHLEETVIRRVLQHDLLSEDEDEDTDPRILEQVFRIACRYAGQDPGPRVFVPEIRGALGLEVDWPLVVTYLCALDESLLLRRIPPRELRLRRQEQRHKLCLSDHSLRAAWLDEQVALTPEALAGDPASSRLAGPLAESVVGSFLRSVRLDVAWLPARKVEPEIDFVVTVGDQLIPIEVKYRQRIDPRRDIAALVAFIDQEINRAPFGLLVTLHDGVEAADPRVVALPLSSLLLLR